MTQKLEMMKTGSLVSGLIIFQVVLLALMGSNNAAREIAGERLIFEKEKFAGVRPSAYIASKAAFLGVLVLAQAGWMAVFVNYVVQFKGNALTQMIVLILVNAALTSVCLALSSLMKTAEQASLVSIYLVGFQLPLSGAVLALPKALGAVTQPFIASYWGWSGFIQTMHETRFYDAMVDVTAGKRLAVGDLLFATGVGLPRFAEACSWPTWAARIRSGNEVFRSPFHPSSVAASRFARRLPRGHVHQSSAREACASQPAVPASLFGARCRARVLRLRLRAVSAFTALLFLLRAPAHGSPDELCLDA